jgi:hypothetical protein
MDDPLADDEIQRHTASLRRLVLSGWTATVVGEPTDPEAIVYMRDVPGMSDAVLVKSYDDAVATRTVVGHPVRTIQGTVSDVVDVVLAWTPLLAR